MSILGKAARTEEWSLLCTHEEADIRILFHILRLENQSNFTMRTADTDCLINEVGCSEKLDTSLKIWLEVGVCGVEITCDLSVLILYTLI